jgi:hypothetical protein
MVARLTREFKIYPVERVLGHEVVKQFDHFIKPIHALSSRLKLNK